MSKFPAKWITQTMRGAPQIVAQPGAVILAIDALLLSGWGATTAVSITVQGGVATAVMNEGIYFEEFSVVLIAGVTSPAQLNGEAFVFSRTNKSISFITDAPDGVAAGNFTIKYAPVGGWEKTYSDTNKAVYRSLDPKSPGHFLRVDDTNPQSVRVRAFETMTDIDTGTGPYPTDAQCAGGGYWYKNYLATANNTVIPYVLAGDNLMMLVAISGGITSSAGRTGTIARGFGLQFLWLLPGILGRACCRTTETIRIQAVVQERCAAEVFLVPMALLPWHVHFLGRADRFMHRKGLQRVQRTLYQETMRP